MRLPGLKFTFLLMTLFTSTLLAQPATPPKTALLWPNGAPGALGTAPADQPRLTLYPAIAVPGRETHTAVLVIPGGAYAMLATDHEGVQIARWLNNLGVSAFMLEYRLGPRYHHPIELGDASRALRWVRSHAAEFNFDANRVGVWGFSAGGHLASTLGTHFKAGDPSSTDPIERVSSRPDFMILTYPVIGPVGPASERSFDNLLGEHPDPALVEELSNDKHVTADTPPAFLVHTDADKAVWPENSVTFYLALRRAGVPAELHVFQNGDHGFGLAQYDAVLSAWSSLLANWLRVRGLLHTN
jgi:acetyl esterase/lipase